MDQEKAIPVGDRSTHLRVPRDRVDVPLTRTQDGQLMSLTAISRQLKEILSEQGVSELAFDQPTILELGEKDECSEVLQAVGREMSGRVGAILLPGIQNEKNSFFNVLPFVERDGKKYRVIQASGTKFHESIPDGVSDEEIEAEINKIFIPSQLRKIDEKIFLLMPILSDIEHVTTLTAARYQDFIDRIKDSKVLPSFDIDDIAAGVDPLDSPEINLTIHNGEVYISDAGDIFHGKWKSNQEDGENEISYVQSALMKRVKES